MGDKIDPRQSKFTDFTGGLQHFKNEETGEEVNVIPMTGRWTAAGVNLGELFDLVVEKLQGEIITDREIFEILRVNIQRLRSFQAKETDTHWNIKFSTKDDHSFYHYSFSIFKKRLE